MPPRIVILADDLSGAADCAAACHRAGLDARVCLAPRALCEPAQAPDDSAWALDLDSRALPAAEALARTLAVEIGPPIGRGALYRKIDSTLRGHVALDIAATLQIAGPSAVAIVCPAYPATGRTVKRGQVYVAGQRLQDTEIWALGGRGSTDLSVLLAEAGLEPVGLDLRIVRGPALRQAMAAARAGGARALVCDAETEGDLEAIVAAGLGLPQVVWAGSGGLTAPLARALSPGAEGAPQPVCRRAGPTLVVVGSASTVSRRQLAHLAEDSRVQTLLVPPAVLLEGPEGSGWRPASRAIVGAVGKPGKDVVALAIDPAAAVDPAAGPALAASLGLLAGRQLGRFGALLATGGETARFVLAAAGVEALCIRRELEPGVVMSAAGALPVVTKAGAFGGPHSVAAAVEVLRGLPLAERGLA
jgi:uncharacterized protein YgbK (DUF1537 family)